MFNLVHQNFNRFYTVSGGLYTETRCLQVWEENSGPSFLPKVHIQEAFQDLQEAGIKKPGLKDLADYIQSTWLDSTVLEVEN